MSGMEKRYFITPNNEIVHLTSDIVLQAIFMAASGRRRVERAPVLISSHWVPLSEQDYAFECQARQNNQNVAYFMGNYHRQDLARRITDPSGFQAVEVFGEAGQPVSRYTLHRTEIAAHAFYKTLNDRRLARRVQVEPLTCAAAIARDIVECCLRTTADEAYKEDDRDDQDEISKEGFSKSCSEVDQDKEPGVVIRLRDGGYEARIGGVVLTLSEEALVAYEHGSPTVTLTLQVDRVVLE